MGSWILEVAYLEAQNAWSLHKALWKEGSNTSERVGKHRAVAGMSVITYTFVSYYLPVDLLLLLSGTGFFHCTK